MTIHKQFSILFLLCVCPFLGFSQDSLTLSKAVSIALEKNLDIRKSENDLRLSTVNKQRSIADLFPDVNIYGSGTSVTGLNFDQVSGQVYTETGKYFSSNINVNWDVINLFSGESQIKQASSNANSQDYLTESTKDITILAIVGRYLEILQATEQKVILDQIYKTQEEQLTRTDEFIKVGSLPEQDHFIQQALLSNVSSLVMENERLIKEKTNELLWILNLEPGTVISCSDSNLDLLDFKDEEVNSIITDESSLDNSYSSALENRNDLKSLESALISKKSDLTIQRFQFAPKFFIFYNYGSGYSSFQPNDFRTQFRKDNITSSYGFSLEIPIFNGFSRRYSAFNTKMIYENAQIELDQKKSRIYMEITNARMTVMADRSIKTATEEQLAANKIVYDIEQEKYELGATNLLTVSIAQRDYIETSLKLVKVNFKLLFDNYSLSYYSGSRRF